MGWEKPRRGGGVGVERRVAKMAASAIENTGGDGDRASSGIGVVRAGRC